MKIKKWMQLLARLKWEIKFREFRTKKQSKVLETMDKEMGNEKAYLR